jgi:hypothetical protein
MSGVRQRPLTLLSLPVLAAAVLAAAGCGGTSNSTAASGTTSGATPAGQTTTTPGQGGGFGRFANVKFTSCLKAQGVTLPSGGFRRRSANGQPPTGQPPAGGGAFSNPKTRAAFQACRKYLPNGGQFGRGGNGGRPGGFNSAAFTRYRTCLTQHGIKLTGGGPLGGANVASPAFQAAAKACRSLAPQFGRGGSPPTATTG